MSGLWTNPRVRVWGGLAIAADVAFGPANCASGIEVRTYSGDGTFTNNDFYININ